MGSNIVYSAGVEGIEPPIAVLETAVIPFNYTPMSEMVQACLIPFNYSPKILRLRFFTTFRMTDL